MTKRKLLISLLLFLIYAVIVWFGAGFVVAGTNFFLVVFVLLTLGLTVLIVYLLIARAQPAPAAAPAVSAGGQESERPAPVAAASGSDPEIVALTGLIAEANVRLAKSPKLASRRVKTTLTKLPLFLLGGTEGAGKTSTFLKSGLEPELLAGQVFRDNNVVPTRLANLWFAEDSLFAEVSGGLFSGDPGRWSGLLARLQGRSAGGFIKRLFGGSRQCPASRVRPLLRHLALPRRSRSQPHGRIEPPHAGAAARWWANPSAPISRSTWYSPRATPSPTFRNISRAW